MYQNCFQLAIHFLYKGFIQKVSEKIGANKPEFSNTIDAILKTITC